MKTEYHMYCGICGAIVDGEAVANPHMKAHALAGEGVGNTYSGSVEVPTGRYYCSCGAWQ